MPIAKELVGVEVLGFFISFSVILISVPSAKKVDVKILLIWIVLLAATCVHVGLAAIFRLQVIVVAVALNGVISVG